MTGNIESAGGISDRRAPKRSRVDLADLTLIVRPADQPRFAHSPMPSAQKLRHTRVKPTPSSRSSTTKGRGVACECPEDPTIIACERYCFGVISKVC